MDVQIETSWKKELEDEFTKPYFTGLVESLRSAKAKGATIYPAGREIFAAFEATPFADVKVVILGQDPYHGPGQAHGLSFSVPEGVAVPPSLRNIFKELNSDTGAETPADGNLQRWARQGVLLLNATLTVAAAQANSHSQWGWHHFTDRVIEVVSQEKAQVVFILWGKFAQSKIPLIDARKHCIIATAHPSPLSAHNGFFGSRPFTKTNLWLQSKGIEPIHW